MKLSCCAAALLLAFFPDVGWARTSPSRDAGRAPESATRAIAPTTAAPSALGEYRSAFSDYRGFTPEEPLVDWRAANEAVSNAGGRVGLMRATPRPDASRAAPAAVPKPQVHKGHR